MTGIRRLAAPIRTTLLPLLVVIASCASEPQTIVTPITIQGPSTDNTVQAGTLSGEIQLLVEAGTPSSLQRALDIIRSRDLGTTDFGRIMSAVSITLMKTLYPDVSAALPQPDPPQTHPYTRILREIEKGNYIPPLPGSNDYLEHVLPFLALFRSDVRLERLNAAMVDLQKASTLSSSSVLDPWFRAIVNERKGNTDTSLALYQEVLSRSSDCYPASVGLARIHYAQGRYAKALELYQDLLLRLPDNQALKRELARTLHALGDWARASTAIAEVLQRDPRDIEFLLMRASTLIEQGFAIQAQPSLDAVAISQPENPRYLYLRARVQLEGYQNTDAALNYLRALLRLQPDHLEATALSARILLDSSRPEDVAEGRRLLAVLVDRGGNSLLTTDLALKDAIFREDWRAAERLVERLLAERRSPQDLATAWRVYVALNNIPKARELARELSESAPGNNDWAALWAESLILSGAVADARAFMLERLAQMPGGTAKSRFHYLLSTLEKEDEARLADLRSSLFEDPRNLDALVAMFDIYHARKDQRRAVYYLKQALAVSPDNARLKRYQSEYASLLAGN